MTLPPAQLAELGYQAELAGLNATSPPQQQRIHGWLLRLSPGQAKRARCVNALEAGELPLDELLKRCEHSFAAAGLPLVIRLTPYSKPVDLDAQLAARGWPAYDAADVMLRERLDDLDESALPGGQFLHEVRLNEFAAQSGTLKAASAEQIAAQAERLQQSAVPYRAFWLRRNTVRGWELLAAGLIAQEGPWVGLYDIYTVPEFRRQGHAHQLCRALLLQARGAGAERAYLQVGRDNQSAIALYQRLGFIKAYGYHYRSPPGINAEACAG